MSPRSCVVEHDGDAALAVQLHEEVPHALLRDDVEPDRRLVEEHDLGIVEQRRGEVAAHALAERELSHGRPEERLELEELGEARQVLLVALLRHAIDVTEQLERVAQRQVPPELDPLAEDDADPPRQLDPLPRGIEPGDANAPGRGHEDPGEHLDRGRLAGAVRAEVAEELALLHGERDPVDRVDDPALAAHAALLRTHDERLADVLELDRRGHEPTLR